MEQKEETLHTQFTSDKSQANQQALTNWQKEMAELQLTINGLEKVFQGSSNDDEEQQDEDDEGDDGA